MFFGIHRREALGELTTLGGERFALCDERRESSVEGVFFSCKGVAFCDERREASVEGRALRSECAGLRFKVAVLLPRAFQIRTQPLFFSIHSREALGELTAHHGFLFKKDTGFAWRGLGNAKRILKLLELGLRGRGCMAGASQFCEDLVERRENRLEGGNYFFRSSNKLCCFFDVLRLGCRQQGIIELNGKRRKIGFQRQITTVETAMPQR